MIATAAQLAPSKPRALACAHCGLSVPPGLSRADRVEQYCCSGCETAAAVIRGCGLERFYALREGEPPAPAKPTGRPYDEFDDPRFHELYCRPLPGGGSPIAENAIGRAGLCSTELYLENVHCAACVWLLEKLPAVVPGVIESRLDFARGLVRIRWNPAAVRLSRIARVIDSLGYPAHPARQAGARAIRRAEDRRHVTRLAVAGACAGNTMLLALALYAGVFQSMDPEHAALFRLASMAITVISMAWPGAVFFRGAWTALRTRTLTLDVPIALGLAAGGTYGVFNTLRGSGEIYFDSLSVLVFALLLGRFVQLRRQRSAADSIELLFSLTPRTARIADDGGVREVPIEAVATGMLVEIRAGDSVPVDGTIVEGDSTLDSSQLTGEARPCEVGAGDAVHAGAVNLSGRLVVRVHATGQQTRIGQLMRLVEEGARRRPEIVGLADRVAGRVMAAMLALAALTFALWSPVDPARAVEHAVALLIVTCPCALGLATPLAATAAIGRAARRQILVKGGDVLERLARPGTILLDKTGTITTGRVSLVEWRGDRSARPLVAAVERHSSHPIARALVEGLDAGATAGAPVDVTQTVGGGIEGRVGCRSVAVGSPAFVHDRAPPPPADLRDAVAEFAASGHTPVLIAVDGRVVAAAALGDSIRPDAAAAIADLSRAGWRVLIRSGDHPAAVGAVARRLGIAPAAARGGMSPEDKLADVESGGHAAPVVMVGDGVNDAAALAAATVGIGVHGGAEASLAAADVYLGRPGLAPIVELVRASRRTIRVIRLNFVAAIAYNALAAGLALAGQINPLIAAILMPASSLTVLTLSFRARTFGDR